MLGCTVCNRGLDRCICLDADDKIAQLENSPYLAIDFEYIKAHRLLNKFDIERDRKENDTRSKKDL